MEARNNELPAVQTVPHDGNRWNDTEEDPQAVAPELARLSEDRHDGEPSAH